MGVIAVQFQFWFQFNRHNKTQDPPPPTSSPCPAVLIGRGSCLSSCSRPANGQPGGLVMVLTV